jgi:hypothetical protein
MTGAEGLATESRDGGQVQKAQRGRRKSKYRLTPSTQRNWDALGGTEVVFLAQATEGVFLA